MPSQPSRFFDFWMKRVEIRLENGHRVASNTEDVIPRHAPCLLDLGFASHAVKSSRTETRESL